VKTALTVAKPNNSKSNGTNLEEDGRDTDEIGGSLQQRGNS